MVPWTFISLKVLFVTNIALVNKLILFCLNYFLPYTSVRRNRRSLMWHWNFNSEKFCLLECDLRGDSFSNFRVLSVPYEGHTGTRQHCIGALLFDVIIIRPLLDLWLFLARIILKNNFFKENDLPRYFNLERSAEWSQHYKESLNEQCFKPIWLSRLEQLEQQPLLCKFLKK